MLGSFCWTLVNETLSVPKNRASTVADAELTVLWPEAYVGCAGVASNGTHAASAVVSGLPSVSAWLIPVIGRQRLYVNLPSQHATLASSSAMSIRAKSRASSGTVSPRATETCWAIL